MRSVLTFVALVLLGCAGAKPQPTGVDPAKGDLSDGGELSSGDEAASSDGGGGGGEGAAGGGGTAQSVASSDAADAGPGGGSPSDPGSASAVPEDECTPVGVDFEKRNRPKLKECYREGKKKDPNLEGTVRIAVSINLKGVITNIKITENTLPKPVAQCMLKVVKSTPFPEAKKCPDKNITIPMTFPTPH